jgi:hypothetical protein
VSASFDRFSRTPEDLSKQFAYFGEFECPPLGGHIYQALCREIKNDRALLDLAADTPTTQPPPNLLFAAVHYLLLAGDPHPLRQWYPELAQGGPHPVASAYPPFRDFCLTHASAISERIKTQRVQTNVLQRCSTLLPGFAQVFLRGGEKPLSLVEIGASAGLNLQWDRFSYRYDKGPTWGHTNSPVSIECEIRGGTGIPTLPEKLPVSWRRGIDLHPIDLQVEDQVLWLRALAWPDHPGRQERLTSAIQMARESPVSVHEGDAATSLAELIAQVPDETTLCVYGTHTLYQFPRNALIATLSSMQSASVKRTIHFLSAEGTAAPDAELFWTIYEGGGRETRQLARCCPHGRWLSWLG